MSRIPSFPATNRRTFLGQGSLFLAATQLDPREWWMQLPAPTLRIGLLTDLHYADKPPAGSRHYRETPAKLAEAKDEFRARDLSLVVELGDFIDAADSVETEQQYLQTINASFSEVHDDRHYVLGNHCVDTLTKDEFLEGVGQPRSYYSFDRDDFHFIVLDSCFRRDGTPYQRRNFEWTDANLPPEELDWLRDDLREAKRPTVVFAHQRLDVDDHYGVRNQRAARGLFTDSGNVLAVFQGHSHRNDLKEIDGIPYCTLVAMVEGSGPSHNGYSILEIAPDTSLRLSGFRKQSSREWKP